MTFYFLRTEVLGEGPLPSWSYPGGPPKSYAWFCPRCGEIWARRLIGNIDQWMVWTIPCDRHPATGNRPPGSLWLSWDREYLEALPEQVLKRELLLHCDYYERTVNHE